ncbi:IclR family transcriptional regulator [Acidovorax sp. BL-A-41-H1]|uniref:IclR family transcriptional regulator n=1 Tax=Acidovorax sp. BL-A-41-H1 TaxID=3421102 RepID=UPI003F792E00
MPTSASAPADTSTKRRQRVQSAETGMTILKALARLGGAASLTAIAAECGESAAKVHRYLSSLTSEGLVAQHPATQHYHLGPEAVRIGLAALRQCDPVRMGEAALLRLRESLQVTCFIAVMGNMGPTVMRMEEPSLPVTVNIRPGSVLPVVWSASGQAFLAFSQDADLRTRAEAELAAATPEQRAMLGGADPVQALCHRARAQGCATVQDILLAGISAIAAPIYDARGHVAAVLTSLGASNGFDARPDGRVGPSVVQEAQGISAAMGFSATGQPPQA